MKVHKTIIDSSPLAQLAAKLWLLTACWSVAFAITTSSAQDGTQGELSEIDQQIDAITSKFDARLENLASRPEEIASKTATVGVEAFKTDLQKCQERLNELTKILYSRQSNIKSSTSLSSSDKKELIAAIDGQLQSAERVSRKASAVLGKIAELPAAEKVWNEQYSSFAAVKGGREAADKVAASIREFRASLPGQERATTSAANRAGPPQATPQSLPRVAALEAKTQADRSGERYPQTLDARLSFDDVRGLNQAQLRYAINEMYARYGLVFRDKQIQRNFERMKWYSPQASLTPAQIEERFTPLERANLEILAQARDGLAAKSSASAPAKPQREFTNPIAYFSACQEHVDANWKSPSMRFPPGHSAIALVKATIGSDGRLMSTQWIQRSGYKEWDQAVLNCLQRIPPFPAPPAWLGHRPAVQLVFPET